PESQTPAGSLFVPQHPAGSVSERKPLGNQRDARPAFFAGRSAWDFSKRDTHFSLHKAVSLSRTLHFHRSFPLVYRDRLAISYRDHVHHVGRFAELSDQETTARSGAECGFHF